MPLMRVNVCIREIKLCANRVRDELITGNPRKTARPRLFLGESSLHGPGMENYRRLTLRVCLILNGAHSVPLWDAELRPGLC